jgi:multicomponent Na+:H+ antiporter subunit B
MRRLTSLLFLAGLGLLLATILQRLNFGQPPMIVGDAINAAAPAQVGAANLVTSVVLAYRGFDTLLELTILFTAATAAGLALGREPGREPGDRLADPEAGPIVRAGADLFFPLLLVVGLYIIFHGHLTPGGGFQGGVILAAAFFMPQLARPASRLEYRMTTLIEGLAGATFILIGLLALFEGEAFLTPLLGVGTQP